MYKSRLFAIGCVLFASGCSSSSESGASSTSAGGSSNGGTSANNTVGGSDSGGTSTTNSSAGGAGSTVGGSPSFCVLGSLGCLCDTGSSCATGLACENSICCDASTGNCGTPIVTGVVESGGTTSTGAGGSSAKVSGVGGKGGAAGCVPGVIGPVITDCGYPYASNNPLTNVAFNESEVLAAIVPSGGAPLASVRLYYGDEHALTLGVRSVVVKSSTGADTTDYAVSPLASNPGTIHSPQTGTNQLTGDQSGLDPSLRPMWPTLFVTDITDDPNSRSGDWQQGGIPYNPNAVFGTWKAAVRNVDTTVTPNLADITPDPDPAKNNWNLGGGDPVPTSLAKNEGYGAEVRWDLVLIPGHSYRIQVLVHDGDQNKVGGDSGEACVDFCAEAACPEGSAACVTTNDCPQGADCAYGCCLMQG